MAFHPYPQVIPPVFNLGGFGPPRGLTRASACPWIDHTASGLGPATRRPFQTRFRYGYPSNRLTLLLIANSPAHSSKGTLSPSQVRAPTVCRHAVSGTISLPSRGTFHHSLTVLSAIGRWRVFSLMGWSPRIRTGFHGARTTREHQQEARRISPTGLLPSVVDFSMSIRLSASFVTPWEYGSPPSWVPQHPCGNACRLSHHMGLGSTPFARHY